MQTAGVAHCRSCHAVINVKWSACLACRHPVVTKGEGTWQAAWSEVARLTLGVTRDDPRFGPTIVAIEQCDNAFLVNDWLGFQQAAQQVQAAVRIDG